MALPKEKQRKEPKSRDAQQTFDPTWNRRSGTVDSKAGYIHAACREPTGWFRGARIR